jgi:bacillolysin
MKKYHLILLAFFIATQIFGQMKPKRPIKTTTNPIKVEDIAAPLPIRTNVPTAEPSLFDQPFKIKPIKSLPKPVSGHPSLMAQVSPETGTPYLIKGELSTDPSKPLDQQVQDYLLATKSVLKLNDPVQEFQLKRTETDELGIRHTRLQQQWQGVPVHGAEAILHEKDGKFYLFNGRFFPSPKLADVTPVIQPEVASQIALAHVSEKEVVKPLATSDLQLLTMPAQTAAKLVIFHQKNTPHLAWHVSVVPNMAARYSYFVDAKTGEILNQHSELCKIAGHFHGVDSSHPMTASPAPDRQLSPTNWELDPDGPATANANDLFGQSRLINTYQVGNTFFLIDASQTMFNNAQSVLPNEPVGVIWTINAENTSPENDDFGAVHITSGNNAWNNPKAVSAHFHAEKAYDYFKNTFGRNSINGQGGNIVSLINVVEGDGSQMDNAFWNGQAMFYGNGSQAFTAPLQKALDVAGHEMSHGVIQATANLEYLNESGALNESFADVFGAMIDRDDWQMGEDLTNTQFFPTGALRDLSDPHNGGNSLNDNGWQPAHYTERYQGNEDNGGVHINSGIVNKAFFLFASNGSVGKSKAEKIWYKALADYLTHSSNFVDCRLAVVQAATDFHGANSAEVNAAKSAFDAVGIGSSGGSSNQEDIETNPGEEFILMTDLDYSKLYIYSPDGTAISDPLTDISPYSRPSVTDDGATIVYIDTDNKMRSINIDWGAGSASTQVIQADPIWHNVAISKDGARLAAILLDDDNDPDNDNYLYVYDFEQGGSFFEFELTNPTTAQDGPSSDNVKYADVLEWDHTGQWVMYDALSAISTGTQDIEFWDISFLYAWDGGFYGNGYIEKLFSSLPENTSVANPTFSKNSDYIIAFDFYDEATNEYSILGSNTETGDVGDIFPSNSDWNWPNYSIDDSQIVFNAFTTSGTQVLAFIPLENDKITASGNATIFLENKQLGVWFANGERALAANDLIAKNNIRIYPNPVGGQLNLDFSTKKAGDVQVQVFDLMGRLVLAEKISSVVGENRHHINTEGLVSGQYLVRLSMEEGQATMKIIKNL